MPILTRVVNLDRFFGCNRYRTFHFNADFVIGDRDCVWRSAPAVTFGDSSNAVYFDTIRLKRVWSVISLLLTPVLLLAADGRP